jgi:hypothetical protein
VSLGLGGDTPKRNQDQPVGGDTVDRAAEALWNSIWESSEAWELASDGEKRNARSWAEAAIAALGLTPEQAMRDRAHGQIAHLSEDGSEPDDYGPNWELVSRLVSSWEVQP